MSYCESINHKDGLLGLEDMTKLTSLTLNNLKGISLKILENIFKKNESKLLKLNLNDCEGVNDSCLALIAKSCIKLKELHLNNCKEITDISLHALAYSDIQLNVLTLQRYFFYKKYLAWNSFSSLFVSFFVLLDVFC